MGVCIACSLEVQDDELTEGLCVNCASETVTSPAGDDQKNEPIESVKQDKNAETLEK